MSSDTLYGGVSRVQSFPPPPTLTFHLPRSLGESKHSSSNPHINPSVLVIVIILSVVFFCSGILHILARCLGRRRASEPPGGLSSPSISIRGQLQHLFSLHDSGVDQVFIDTLPVFLYGSIRGLKESADCAVCLTEFANEDKLRLLPKCKHAFHTECIDKWLLSNSTCPLCRRSLLPEAEPSLSPPEPTGCAAALPQEEQGASQPQPSHGSFRGSFRASLRGSFRFLTDAVAPPPPPSERETAQVFQNPNPSPSTEIQTSPMTPGPTVCVTEADGSEKLLRVELGKVNSFDSRRVPTPDVGTSRMPRSYSMGSYEYVVDFSTLGLPTPLPSHHTEDKSPSKPTHRSTLSDSIPELGSASHTPGQEDMFWAIRGLATPRSLSRAREIMTPSPGWCSSPLRFESQNTPSSLPKQEATSLHLQQIVNIDHNEEHGEIEVASAPNEHKETEMVEERSSSLRVSSPLEKKIEARALQRSSTFDSAGMEKLATAARMDKLWEVSVDVPGRLTSAQGSRSSPSKKLSPLNWLRGSLRRNLVYSAASPSSTDMQSTKDKMVDPPGFEW